jgi:hypothetical protein
MNYKYAEIIHNKISQIIDTTSPIDSSTNNMGIWIEISNAHPQPTVGWLYNPVTGLFGPPTNDRILLQQSHIEGKREIDQAAGQARLKFITDIPGQAEIYREKYEQAVDFLSSTNQVDYANFPLLRVEANILNLPMKNIAEIIIKKRMNWITKISAIEFIRLNGKQRIDVCTTAKEVQKVVGSIVHQLYELK